MASRVVRMLGGPLRALLVVVILALGAGSMVALSSMKTPPAQTGAAERVLRVEVVEIKAKDVPVLIRGFGEARALNVVSLSPEVSGGVIEIHPRLEQGEVIPAGELLFRVDPRDYAAARSQAEAQTAQLAAALERLAKQHAIDQGRLKTLERTRDLALKEFERLQTLLLDDEVGTQSGVDAAEMAYNQARDARDQLDQQLALYPTRVVEAENALAAAQAQLQLATTNLERTEVRAPFRARLKEVQVERGQYVRAGTPVLTLSDDSLLEIEVPVDSRDARQWLRFRGGNDGGLAWFEDVEPVECTVEWVEDAGQHAWRGLLSRVTNYDTQNRTVALAVRVDGKDALSADEGLPLVDGMFCAVSIPGKTMENVFELPRWAVTFRNEVYVAREDRLAIRPVTVVRSEGESTYVSEGLKPGEAVIVTRLVDPAPRTLLDIVREEVETDS